MLPTFRLGSTYSRDLHESSGSSTINLHLLLLLVILKDSPYPYTILPLITVSYKIFRQLKRLAERFRRTRGDSLEAEDAANAKFGSAETLSNRIVYGKLNLFNLC